MNVVADAIKLPWAFHSDGNLTIMMADEGLFNLARHLTGLLKWSGD